jgi:glycosyltransferase involved in cell wall biosynthesis
MPVYNGQRYVDEAIASVVGQDYPDFEFVIVDDGSTDGTPAILAAWARRDSRIVLVRSPRNEGISAALNRGLAVARGEYVARQDADDLCVPRRLAQQVAVLDADPGVELVSAGYELMESDGRRRRVLMRDEAPELVEYLLHFSNFIGGHGQVMFRRATVAEAGNYDVAYPYSQDYDLWSKLMRRGRCVVLPIIGMRHRMHEHRVSVVWGKRQQTHSVEISRQNLEVLLQRKLSDEEIGAVAAVWRYTGERGMARSAHRVFTETYGHFAAKNVRRRHRRRVRIYKARIWVIGAAMHIKHGQFLESLQYLAYAMRWHPLGVVSGSVAVARRGWAYLRRQVRLARVSERWRLAG